MFDRLVPPGAKGLETQLGTVQNPGWLILVWGSTVQYMIYIYIFLYMDIYGRLSQSIIGNPFLTSQ